MDKMINIVITGCGRILGYQLHVDKFTLDK
jgi:hypothetical protein